jgi:hypothetical protein
MEVDSQPTIQGSQPASQSQRQEPQRRNARFQQPVETAEERPKAIRRKPHELPPPIKGMVGRRRFSLSSILELDVTMKLGQFIDVSPAVRGQLAGGMRSSVSRNRNPGNQQGPVEPAASADHVWQDSEPITPQAKVQEETVPTCLYITTWVNNQPLYRTLVDSGSAINLISLKKAQELGLKPRPINGIGLNLRTASDDLVPMTEEVEMEIGIGKTKMNIKAGIIGIGAAYDLLLSRSWMEAVEAIEDFKHKKLTVKGPDGARIRILPTPEDLLHDCQTEVQFPYTQEDLEEDQAEEALDDVFKDMDTDIFKPQPLSGNG